MTPTYNMKCEAGNFVNGKLQRVPFETEKLPDLSSHTSDGFMVMVHEVTAPKVKLQLSLRSGGRQLMTGHNTITASAGDVANVPLDISFIPSD